MCLGIPGRIVEITDPVNKLGLVDVCGVRRQINLACIVDAQHPLERCVGDWVLVHVGFAITKVDEHSAMQTLEAFRVMGLLDEEFGEPV